MGTAINKKASEKKKLISKVIWFIGIGLVIIVSIFFFSKNEPEGIKEDKILLKEGMPSPIDAGVISSGFEDDVIFSGFNAKPARSGYKKISGNASLYIIFEDKDNTAVKVKDYIDGIYEEGFYRLNFWAKANNNKELIISIAEEDSIQELGSIKLIGDEETRFYEFLFQAEDSAENLIISSVDKSVTDVWLDDVFVNELEVNSIEEMKNLQSTVVGETFWKNISHAQIGGLENNSGDFFSRPDKQLGQIIQLNKEMLSGIVLKIQKKGTGGKGNYQLRIREVDESTRIPADNIFISANIDCNFQPSIQAEIKEKEKIMQEELVQNEKAIVEKRVVDNLAEAAEKIYPVNLTEEEAIKRNKEERKQLLNNQIREMKEGFNAMQEIVIPIATKLDPEKKYLLEISNKGVVVDRDNYLKIFFTEEGNGKMLSSENNLSLWREYSGNLWFKTLYPKFSSKDGDVLPSGATIIDLGQGKGCLRYAFKGTDYNCFSGFNGRKIYDMDSGKCDHIDSSGNCILVLDYAEEDNYAIYKFKAFHPIEKIILRDIIYWKSLYLEISFDGKYWEEIVSEETDDPKNHQGTISHLALKGDNESDIFYLRISPQGEEGSLISLDLEALLLIVN